MLFLFLVLWAISVILIAIDRGDESMRRFSMVTFCGGCGALAVFLREQVLPGTVDHPALHYILLVLIGVLFVIAINFGPYVYLLFGISYSGLFCNRWLVWKSRLAWLCIIPPVLMGFFYPLIPSYEPSYLVMSIWVVPYFGAASFFLLYAFLGEKDAKAKQQRLLTFIAVTPFVMFSILANYILHIFKINELWRYSPWLITHFFFIFIFLGIKYGFLGVRLRFEKYHQHSTRAVTSGISVLSHSLNNGLSKIKVKTEEIMENGTEDQENARFILNSVDHMFAMLEKIKQQMKDLVFEERTINLIALIEDTLPMLHPFLGMKEIAIRKYFSHNIEILGDPVHLKELLINLCKNAIEATKSSGELVLDLSLKRNRAVLVIRDTGAGIPREKLAQIGEPFWTTKDGNRNYGLGLWYCSKVMSHYGKLELFSKENQGTVVYLYFYKAKVTGVSPVPAPLEVQNESD
jgi:signal transduction histidine kinase